MGTGFARIVYRPCAARVYLFTAKHSAGNVFLQGLEGNRKAYGGTCSVHVACAFVFTCAAAIYNIARSLCMSVQRCLWFMWIEQQCMMPVRYKCNERSQKGEITS